MRYWHHSRPAAAALGYFPRTFALLVASILNSLVRFITIYNTNGRDHENKYLTSSVDQTIVWYAGPVGNANVWKKELDAGTYNSWPILESRLRSDKPASFLACVPDSGPMNSPPQCWYLPYWEHWFTAIFFYRQSNGEMLTDDLLLQDIRQLRARADQLLMSAPDEPCFNFLCTGK